VGAQAGDLGVDITVEVHQHSIADNSWSTLHLLELTDSPHVSANPDLGNILWTYETPEESSEEAIVALAAHSKYWHCKNLNRVHIPEIEHSYFIRVPLPDGDIDYRFALEAMNEANYDGYMAIEGANTGDQLSKDRKSVEYINSVLTELDGA
jgi:sugar phosphate isomerase/epimerase